MIAIVRAQSFYHFFPDARFGRTEGETVVNIPIERRGVWLKVIGDVNGLRIELEGDSYVKVANYGHRYPKTFIGTLKYLLNGTGGEYETFYFPFNGQIGRAIKNMVARRNVDQNGKVWFRIYPWVNTADIHQGVPDWQKFDINLREDEVKKFIREIDDFMTC